MCQASNQAVTHAVNHFIDKANEAFNLDMPYPAVGFAVRGGVGGKAWSTEWRLGFNTGLMVDNLAHYVEQVAPHEVAHLVCYVLQGNRYEYKYTKRGQPRRVSHGKLFYKVMRAFGVDEERCHSMDTSKVKRATRNVKAFPVRCTGCAINFTVGMKRRNKILNGVKYIHSCGGGKKAPIQLVSTMPV